MKVWDGVRIKLPTPGSAVGLATIDQILFSYFCWRSSSDHFYQIILNSDHQLKEIFKICLNAISHAPCQTCFWWIKFLLAFFVEGHLITISAKSISIPTTGFRSFLHRRIRETVYAPGGHGFCQIKFIFKISYFCGRSSSDHCQIPSTNSHNNEEKQNSNMNYAQVKDTMICLTPHHHQKNIHPRNISENCVFHQNINKISFHKFFMVHYDYLIERYLCSIALSALTRYHLQFCSRSSPNIASGTNFTA